MAKILVLYYSQTGNTQKMAEAVTEGTRSVQGVDVKLKYHAMPEKLADFDAVVVGIRARIVAIGALLRVHIPQPV